MPRYLKSDFEMFSEGQEAANRALAPLVADTMRRREFEDRIKLESELHKQRLAHDLSLQKQRADLEMAMQDRDPRAQLQRMALQDELQRRREENIPVGRAVPYTPQEAVAAVNADRARAGLPAASADEVYAMQGIGPLPQRGTGKPGSNPMMEQVKAGKDIVGLSKDLEELGYDSAPMLEGAAAQLGVPLQKKTATQTDPEAQRLLAEFQVADRDYASRGEPGWQQWPIIDQLTESNLERRNKLANRLATEYGIAPEMSKANSLTPTAAAAQPVNAPKTEPEKPKGAFGRLMQGSDGAAPPPVTGPVLAPALNPQATPEAKADPQMELPLPTARTQTGMFAPFGGAVQDPERINAGLSGALKGKGGAFVDAGQRWGVDPGLLAAISMHETGNGTSNAVRNKGNAMGISGPKGVLDWSGKGGIEASIDYMAQRLGQSPIYRKARDSGNIEALASIYAPVGAGNDPTNLNPHWSKGVTSYYKRFIEG